MTAPQDEPEVWVSVDPGPGRGGPPGSGLGRPGGPGRGWGRWIAIIAGFAVLIAVVALQRSLTGGGDGSADPTTGVSPPTAPPTAPTDDHLPCANCSEIRTESPTTGDHPAGPITTAGAPAELDAAPFELVALLWNENLGSAAEVVRYRAGSGETVRTALPALMSNGPLSFVVTDTAAMVRPWDGVPGYVVVDGAQAEVADGQLGPGGPIFPSAGQDRVWATSQEIAGATVPPSTEEDSVSVTAEEGAGVRLELVDIHGHPTGTMLKPPPSLGVDGPWGLRPDGAGGVLADAVGGVYDLTPDETRLVTHGRVLAAGPTGFLVYECEDGGHCSAAVRVRSTGKRTPLPDLTVPRSTVISQFPGVISPDGRYAAILDLVGGPPLSIVDLHTGERTSVMVPIGGRFARDASSNLAFTPDSRVLAVTSGTYVRWVDPATGKVLGELHFDTPPMAIAIRPAP